MVKLRRKHCVQDMDYFDVSDDIIMVDVEQGSSIVEVVLEHFRSDGVDEEDIEQTIEMIETGRWYGGEWRKENEQTLSYVSDVTHTEYSI